MRVCKRHYITREGIMEEVETEGVVEKIDKYCMEWTAHVDRMEDYI
jgi:hypothetical protein